MSRTHKKESVGDRSRETVTEPKPSSPPKRNDAPPPNAAGESASPKVRRFFLLHLKPNRLPAATLRFTHTFGLGGSAAVLFGLLAASGMLLALVYEPSPEQAYRSLLRLQGEYRFGAFVRAVHYFSATLLIGVTLLHLLRVFYTGAFHGVRRLNWIFGVLLLFGVLSAGFTGYLLPWDQLSYWAITVATGMLGYVPYIGESLRTLARNGTELGAGTLVLFYALHTAFIPIALAVLMGFHFWRVRKARGTVVPHPLDEPPDTAPEKVPAYPHLIVREVALGLTVIAGVFFLAALFDAPLGDPANPGLSPNPAKSPWYFLGFQELQLHFHPLLSAVAAPLLLVGALIAVPYLRYSVCREGPWFLSRAGRRIALLTAALTAAVVVVLVVVDDLYLRPNAGVPSLLGRGIVPLGLLTALSFGVHRLLTGRFRLGTAETVQALFTLYFTAFAVLTLVSLWFRETAMALTLPWIGE